MWAAGWGAGKVVAPAIGKYLTEIGILSQKGVPSYIRSAQVGLGKPGEVDVYKKQMRNNTFPLEPKMGLLRVILIRKGYTMYLMEIIAWLQQLNTIMKRVTLSL
ncbi:hypothetical protein LNO92_13065 [Klebsiella variicola subsp. variicola]|nr:hypothetical protein [Klebsiella variicola subsp. variicola]